MKGMLAALAFGLLLAVLASSQSSRSRRMLEQAFAGRRSLTDDEFFQEHFSSMGVAREVPITVRRVLSQELGADLGRVMPDDDFTKNLKFLLGRDSMASVAIVWSLEKEFGVTITDKEASAMHTVKDIVLGVSSKLPAAQ